MCCEFPLLDSKFPNSSILLYIQVGENVNMVFQRKRKVSRGGNTPNSARGGRRRSSIDYSEEGEGSGSHSLQGEGDLTEVELAYEIGNSEWDAPFELRGIPVGLQSSMVAVAPALAGREAEYKDEFFTNHVGLCDRGALVDDVGKVYPQVLEGDIKEIWRPGMQQNRYELVNCTSKIQARQFSKLCYEVYGHRPDNAYFAMRFLKAATATFVHGLEVNWVAEAQGRRCRRIATATKNQYKLGPVALRCQVEGLCGIIKDLARGQPLTPGLPESVTAAEGALTAATAAADAAAEVLRGLQKERDLAVAVLERCTEEDVAKAESESNAALVEQRRVFLTGTPSEYKAQVEVVRASSEKVAKLQEELMTARFAMRSLAEENGPLSMAVADQKKAMAVRVEAEAALKKAKQETLILRPRAVFEYPPRQSVPAIDGGMGSLNEWCPVCSKGFVSRAAILGSCGCLFHHVCVAEMIESSHYRCPYCECELDPAWVKQWDGKLNADQDRQVGVTVEMVRRLGAAYHHGGRNVE